MSAFRHRNYRLFFGGQAISLVGTWMQQVAQAWLVLELTHDPIWLGIVAAAQFIPVMVLGLFAGVAADALPKRQILIATQVVMMVLAAILAVLVITGVVEVWMILVLAFLLGIANAVDMPVRQSFAIELVGREDIGNAVALNSAMFNGARVIGPAARRPGDRRVRRRARLRDQRGELPRGHRRPADDGRGHDCHVAARIARPDSARAVVRNLREGLALRPRSTAIVLLAVVVVGVRRDGRHELQRAHPGVRRRTSCSSGAAGYGFLMAASGVGSLLAAVRARRSVAGRARSASRPGAMILGVGVARAGVRPASSRSPLRPDGPHRLRLDPDGRDRQRDDPAGRPGPPARPGDERLHDGLQRLGPARRPGDGRHRLGVRGRRSRSRSAASCRCWSGFGALAWGRRGAFDSVDSPAPALDRRDGPRRRPTRADRR